MRILSLVAFTLFAIHAYADGGATVPKQAFPETVKFTYSGMFGTVYSGTEDWPVGRSYYVLQYADPKHRDGVIALSRTKDAKICAYSCVSVAHWIGSERLELGFSNSLEIRVDLTSDHFTGDFLAGRAKAIVSFKWFKGNELLADFSFNEDHKTAITVVSPALQNIDVARFLAKKNATIYKYLGLNEFSEELSNADRMQRVKELCDSVGDGKGLIDYLAVEGAIQIEFIPGVADDSDLETR